MAEDLLSSPPPRPKPKARKPKDRAHVNLRHEGERQYWSEKFGVSPGELAKAVDTVGDSSSAIAKHLTTRERAPESS